MSMASYEPDSGYNLPPGLYENHPYFNGGTGTCMTCIHCIEECCDYGQCGRKLDALKPKDFETWGEVLEYLDGFRVDMQEDGCSKWEGA
nr:MAG TPA: hypothetical protein [Caudoviricetes sp.]